MLVLLSVKISPLLPGGLFDGLWWFVGGFLVAPCFFLFFICVLLVVCWLFVGDLLVIFGIFCYYWVLSGMFFFFFLEEPNSFLEGHKGSQSCNQMLYL